MTNPLSQSVTAHEVANTPPIPVTSETQDAVTALATACNGFAYQGGDLDAQLRAIRFLRTRPDIARALGLGEN